MTASWVTQPLVHLQALRSLAITEPLAAEHVKLFGCERWVLLHHFQVIGNDQDNNSIKISSLGQLLLQKYLDKNLFSWLFTLNILKN